MTKKHSPQAGVLYLSLGVDVTLDYNEQHDTILSVTISKSRVGELFRNRMITKDSILKLQMIGIVVGGNANILLEIDGFEPNQEKMSAIWLEIDHKKMVTNQENTEIFQLPNFKFYISPKQSHIHPHLFDALYYANKKYQTFLEENRKARLRKNRYGGKRSQCIKAQEKGG